MLYIILFIVILFYIIKIFYFTENFSFKQYIDTNNVAVPNQPITSLYKAENEVLDKNDIQVIDLKPFVNEKMKNDLNTSITKVKNIYFSNSNLNNIAKNIDINDKKLVV